MSVFAPARCAPTGAAVSRARETKRAATTLAQTSDAGAFEGYASLFGVMDQGGDIVAPGAFTRSLRKRGASGVKMLWQHKSAEPIGVWTLIEEDARGLKVRGKLDLSVARAREALSLMRSRAVDGLSIGFRTIRSAKDAQSGARRLLEVDLWEISLVTFPMLPQARVSAVKRRAQNMDACAKHFSALLLRLRAQEAAQRFETHLRALNGAPEQRYAPNQPRAPAETREGGRWVSGGGGGRGGSPLDAATSGGSGAGVGDVFGTATSDASGGARVALNIDPNIASDAGGLVTPAQAGYPVDLTEEEARGGHTIERHIAKSEEYLLRRSESTRFRLGALDAWEAFGSFVSLQSAGKLVNATLAQNQRVVDLVARGELGGASIKAWFDAPTGYESFAPSRKAQLAIRATSGVRVIVRHDETSDRGFSIVTAFPISLSE